MTEVAIAHDDRDIGRAIDSALSALDFEDRIRGRVVAVKPNDTWASPDDTTGVTQGDTLLAVLRKLKRLGPSKLVVSGGAGAAETEDVFRYSGMLQAVRDEGVELVDHNRAPFRRVELQYAPDREVTGPQHEIMVNERVLEYDTVVSLAQLKLHETATVTLTLKNIAMSYPAADYYGHPRGSSEGHKHSFFADMHSFIAAMVRRFPIGLGIVVGHPAMIGTGPLGGMPIETGLVMASTDAVAVDVVGARLLGFEAQGVRHLWEAGKFGLGETELGNMRFCGLSLPQAIRIFTERAYGRELTMTHA